MDQIADFDSFYTLKLAPHIDQLRAECKTADNWGIVGLVSFLMGIVILFFGLQLKLLKGYEGFLFIVMVLPIVSLVKYAQKNDIFKRDFKEFIIKEIINNISPGIIYKPDESITEREYKASSLFRRYFDYFDGSDYMAGVINNVSFHCSEICTQYDDVNRQRTIFKGLFFVVKINDRFTGGTYVWARGEEQLPATISDERYLLMPMPRIHDIRFQDKDFEHYFRVCTTYESQAMEILSPAFRQQMINLRQHSRSLAAFSFVAGHCYFAFPASQDLLEPSDYDPGDKEEIRKYYVNVALILGIIKQLGLSHIV
ncbi:MAG: DUF3137 domain-containing protein [Ginsengibacter sp.]